MAAFEVLRENTVENTRIKGALVRSFPATATVVVAENNPEGVLFMSICLAAYLGALIMSERILAVAM